MAKTKTIKKNEQFKLSTGELTIKSISGDAHLTAIRIYHNDNLIKTGEGDVECQITAHSGDVILIIATIFMHEGSSDLASLSVEMNDDYNSKRWDYSSPEPDYDVVIYEVTIILT